MQLSHSDFEGLGSGALLFFNISTVFFNIFAVFQWHEGGGRRKLREVVLDQ
jgi:hypothetical protein